MNSLSVLINVQWKTLPLLSPGILVFHMVISRFEALQVLVQINCLNLITLGINSYNFGVIMLLHEFSCISYKLKFYIKVVSVYTKYYKNYTI